MYKDIIHYELAENITQEHLLKVAKQVVTTWMNKQPGFIKWEIHTNNKDTFTDVVYWLTEKDAKNAEKEMANIPNANEWFGCYKEGSISSHNLKQLALFD